MEKPVPPKFLTHLTNLETLHTKVDESFCVQDLVSLTNLRTLKLHRGNCTPIDVSEVSQLTQLTFLSVHSLSVDISGLTDLTRLGRLEFTQCKITSGSTDKLNKATHIKIR